MPDDVYGRAPRADYEIGPNTGAATVADATLVGPQTHKRISWPAIFAGLFVVLAVQLILSLLGIAIGFSAIDPNQPSGTPDASTFGISSAVWFVISMWLALLAGSWAAAWLAGVARPIDAILHGVVTWAITLIVLVYLLGSAVGGIIGGTLNLAGGIARTGVQAAGTAAGGAAAAASTDSGGNAITSLARSAGIDPNVIGQQARELLNGNLAPASMSPEQAQAALVAALTATVTSNGQDAQQARDRAVDIVAAQTNVPRDQAQARVDQWLQQYRDTRQQVITQARHVAAQGADAASQASWWSFAALLLAGVAAAIGGSLGTRREVEAVLARPATTHRT